MNGTITSYLEDKKYGFIKGDDGRDYYFHRSAFADTSQHSNICDQSSVKFDGEPTAKGYRAHHCELISVDDVTSYVIPGDFVHSRTGKTGRWQVIETAPFYIHGSSSNSLDEAKRNATELAERLGANGLIKLEYYKKTDSEPSESSHGTHYFTVHNFRGQPVTVAKRNALGRYRHEELTGLSVRVEKAYDADVDLKAQRKSDSIKVWLFVLFFALLTVLANRYPDLWIGDYLGIFMIASFLGVLIAVLRTNLEDKDSWLERIAN